MVNISSRSIRNLCQDVLDISIIKGYIQKAEAGSQVGCRHKKSPQGLRRAGFQDFIG